MFAIDDFTENNGATVAIPRSHLWGEDRGTPGQRRTHQRRSCPRQLLHPVPGQPLARRRRNRSDEHRLALTAQYCEPWLRTQENYFLSVERETVAGLSEDMKRLLGYSIHPPFMGMVNGMHPKRKPITGR